MKTYKSLRDRLPFGHHPGFLIKSNLQGFRNWYFGDRAGPQCGKSNVLHELAHAIQFAPRERFSHIKPISFIFKWRVIDVLGTLCNEPLTNKATLRECETHAIALHLQQMIGHSFSMQHSIDRFADAIHLLPDSHYNTKDEKIKFIKEYYDKWMQDKVIKCANEVLDFIHVSRETQEIMK